MEFQYFYQSTKEDLDNKVENVNLNVRWILTKNPYHTPPQFKVKTHTYKVTRLW